MKIFTISFAFVLITTALVIHLFSDDKIDEKATVLIEQYAVEPSLDANAHIALLALKHNSKDAYEKARREYLKSVENLNLFGIEYSGSVEYPYIENIPDIYSATENCNFDEYGCFSKLLSNRTNIDVILHDYSPTLSRFLALSEFENFEMPNSTVTVANLDSYMTLVQLVGLRILFLIEDNHLDEARRQLVQLILVERAFQESSLDMVFAVAPLVHFQRIYEPLVRRLLARGNQQWKDIADSLAPLSIEDMSMNKVHIKDLLGSYRLLRFKFIASEAIQNGEVDELFARLKYKENMTLNALFKYIEPNLVVSKDKHLLLDEVVRIKEKNDSLDEEIKAFKENHFLYLVKNYKNVVGSIMAVTATSRFVSLVDEKVEIEARKQLLKLLIFSQRTSLKSEIVSEEYINPYTLKKPFLDGDRICYQLNDLVCTPIIGVSS